MKLFAKYFKQKTFWLALVGISVLVTIFTFAFIGSTVNPVPKDLPVALVVEDLGAEVPNGGPVNFGEQMQQQVQSISELPVKWTVLSSKEEALKGMNDRKYYGAVIIPKTMTAGILSLQSPSPQQPEVEVIINPGMNYTAANAVTGMLDKLMVNVNEQVRNNVFTQLEQRNVQLSPAQAKLLVSPIVVKTSAVNEVGAYTGNGNSPAMFTQILWLTTFIGSMILFATLRKATGGRVTLGSVGVQLVGGALVVTVISSVVLLLTNGVLGVSMPDAGETFLVLLFIGAMFFLLQSAVLNWIGFVGAPLFVLLFFFSMPVLTLPPEFLPEVTKDWLYSWVPFKYSVEAFRSMFFFDGYNAVEYEFILGMIGLVSLVVLVLAVLKPGPRRKDRASGESKVAVQN